MLGMARPGCLLYFCSIIFALVTVSFGISVERTYNISGLGRQTHMYGSEFIIVLPLLNGKLERGSYLQIASSSGANASGTVTLVGSSSSEGFVAAPTFSFPLEVFTFTSQNITILNLTSDHDVTVAAVILRGSAISAFTVIPVDSLDYEYPVASYGSQEDLISELAIVAVAEGITDVYFTPNANNVKLLPGEFQSLSRGESLIYQTADYFRGGHISGNLNALSGIVGSRCQKSGPEDVCPHSAEQLYPLVSLGTQFAAVSINDGTMNNVFRAVAVWNYTNINWTSENGTGSTSINNSEIFDLPSDKLSVTLYGSKPFLLLHHLEKGRPVTDIALVFVPPQEQMTDKTITFSTLPNLNHNQSMIHYITITTPCSYIDNIVLQSASQSRRRLKMNVPPTNMIDVCGSTWTIEAGTYTLGPQAGSPPEAVYTAILYGSTETAVFSYILASELRQIVCGIKSGSEEVILCPMETSTENPTNQPTNQPTDKPTDQPKKTKAEGISLLLVVVIAVVSITVGVIIFCVFFFCYKRYRRNQWRRLDESEYMEDNPIRLANIDVGNTNI